MEHLRYAWRIVLPYVGTLPRFLGFAGSTHDVWLHCGIRCSFRHANKLIYIKSIPAKRRRANYIASATVGIMPRFPPVVNFFCPFRRSFPIFHEKDAEFRCGYPTFLPNGGDFPHFKWNEGSCGTPVLWVCCCFSLVLLPRALRSPLGNLRRPFGRSLFSFDYSRGLCGYESKTPPSGLLRSTPPDGSDFF